MLIYLTLFIGECLAKLNKVPPPSKTEALKTLNTFALQSFSIPGDPNFPLNALYARPGPQETGMFVYLLYRLMFRIHETIPRSTPTRNGCSLAKPHLRRRQTKQVVDEFFETKVHGHCKKSLVY